MQSKYCICRHTGNGAVIARCSQPEVGWLGWRSSADEDLLKAIADACAYDRGRCTITDRGTPSNKAAESDIDGNTCKVCESRSGSDSDACFHLYSIGFKLMMKQLKDLSA
jgi:hypothetical protein